MADPEAAYAVLQAELAPAPPLSPKQARLLALLDQERDNQLSIALLNAYNALPPPDPASARPTPAALAAATSASQAARARHAVRASIIRATLIADPVLGAAHGAAHGAAGAGAAAAVPAPGLDAALGARDALAMLHGATCGREEQVRAEAARAEREAAALWDASAAGGGGGDLVGMARRVVELAGEVADGNGGGEAAAGAEWEAVEREEREAKRKWRIMKGLVAGVVVGSGVRWVENKELVDLVLDEDAGG